jgi:hypothetical protein
MGLPITDQELQRLAEIFGDVAQRTTDRAKRALAVVFAVGIALGALVTGVFVCLIR